MSKLRSQTVPDSSCWIGCLSFTLDLFSAIPIFMKFSGKVGKPCTCKLFDVEIPPSLSLLAMMFMDSTVNFFRVFLYAAPATEAATGDVWIELGLFCRRRLESFCEWHYRTPHLSPVFCEVVCATLLECQKTPLFLSNTSLFPSSREYHLPTIRNNSIAIRVAKSRRCLNIRSTIAPSPIIRILLIAMLPMIVLNS